MIRTEEKEHRSDVRRFTVTKRYVPRMTKLMSALDKTTFNTDPASARYHLNYAGGLAEHSANVAFNLRFLTDALCLNWMDQESPEIIGWAHDVCKIGAYIPYEEGSYYWNTDQPSGHGDLSVYRIEEWLGTDFLTEEEKVCIEFHMGAFVDRSKRDDLQHEWNRYGEAVTKYPNLLYVHLADMKASHVDEIRE
jgi:hypothetical protein